MLSSAVVFYTGRLTRCAVQVYCLICVPRMHFVYGDDDMNWEIYFEIWDEIRFFAQNIWSTARDCDQRILVWWHFDEEQINYKKLLWQNVYECYFHTCVEMLLAKSSFDKLVVLVNPSFSTVWRSRN